MSITLWQKRREVFNHHWLKNDLMMALISWSKLLEGIDEDPETEREFIEKYVRTWPTKHNEAASLIQDFAIEMSPKTLFETYPLSNCDEDTKSWLREVVHQLWLNRFSVNKLVTDANASLNAVSRAYERLVAALQSCEDLTKAREMRLFRKQFDDYRVACERLGSAIEKFPGEILVV